MKTATALAVVLALAGAIACYRSALEARNRVRALGPDRKACGCDIAAPCSDCCGVKDCRCSPSR